MAKNDTLSIDWTPVQNAQEKCPLKVIQKVAGAILKKTDLLGTPPKKYFSFKSTKDVGDLYLLAAYLFAFKQYDLCYDICCICDHVEFNGNYDLWSYIRSLHCMQISILRMSGDENSKASVLLEKLKAHELPADNRIRVFNTTKARAFDFMESYHEQKRSSLRYALLGVSMTLMQFLVMGYLPEDHELMKSLIEKIFDLLRKEEK